MSVVQFSDLSTTTYKLGGCVLVLTSLEGLTVFISVTQKMPDFLLMRNYSVFQQEHDLLPALIANWCVFNSKNPVRNV